MRPIFAGFGRASRRLKRVPVRNPIPTPARIDTVADGDRRPPIVANHAPTYVLHKSYWCNTVG